MSILENLSFKRLNPTDPLKPFDCGDDDLNDFFLNDALNYDEELLAVTYTFEDDKEVVAFFSVLNDKISNDDIDTGNLPSKVYRKIPYLKRRKSYPAVKVGRLGVHKDYKRKGVGSDVLDVIKHSFTTNNKTGCRFITVDAYNCKEVVGFYERNGFKFLTSEEADEDTRLMYYDLMNFQPV